MSGLSREVDDPNSGWGESHVPPLQLHRKRPAKSDAAVKMTRQMSAEAVDRVTRLTRTIESEIIPRLLLANCVESHVAQPPAVAASCAAELNSEAIDQLAVAVVHGSLDLASHQVEALRRSGYSLEAIFLNVLAPTARRLGDAWNEDTLSFAEVTIGLGNLQGLLRRLSPAFEWHRETASATKRILLLQAPSEQHSFGLFMVEAFFRRAGWNVVGAAAMPLAEAVTVVQSEWVDIVGFSQSADSLLDPLASAISALRRASRNRALSVMVGGPAFNGHPERVILVGADATASDARQAVILANRFAQTSAER